MYKRQDILKQIDEAVTAEKARLTETRSDSYAENDDELDDTPAETEEPVLGRGAPRVCRAPDTFKFAILAVEERLRRDLQAVQNWTAPQLCVC